MNTIVLSCIVLNEKNNTCLLCNLLGIPCYNELSDLFYFKKSFKYSFYFDNYDTYTLKSRFIPTIKVKNLKAYKQKNDIEKTILMSKIKLTFFVIF